MKEQYFPQFKEIEQGVERLGQRIYCKSLALITPEKANELGISAESPVFISPYIGEEKKL